MRRGGKMIELDYIQLERETRVKIVLRTIE